MMNEFAFTLMLASVCFRNISETFWSHEWVGNSLWRVYRLNHLQSLSVILENIKFYSKFSSRIVKKSFVKNFPWRDLRSSSCHALVAVLIIVALRPWSSRQSRQNTFQLQLWRLRLQQLSHVSYDPLMWQLLATNEIIKIFRPDKLHPALYFVIIFRQEVLGVRPHNLKANSCERFSNVGSKVELTGCQAFLSGCKHNMF